MDSITPAREVVADQQGAPLLALPPHWRGLDLDVYRVPGREERGAAHAPHPVLFCALEGRGRRWVRYGKRVVELETTVDGIELAGSDYQHDGIRWDGLQGSAAGILFRPAVVERLYCGEAHFDLATRHEFFNPAVARLVRLLLEEAQAGAPNGAIYAESLSCALIALLAQNYGATTPHEQRSGSLAPAMRRRVVEYIETHLGEELSIAGLALEAGLSPHHFARCFSATFKQSPHRYVQQRRISAALRMLELSERPIAEIAHDLGFTDQSHFTKVFRHSVGRTPGQVRNEKRRLAG